LIILDPRLRGNDKKGPKATFYEFIKGERLMLWRQKITEFFGLKKSIVALLAMVIPLAAKNN